jgi:tetratricopeptide (TPR) repeat protein
VVLAKLEQRQEEIDQEESARRLYRLKSFEAIEATYQKRLKELEDAQQATAATLTELQQERDLARSATEKAAEELAKNKPPSVLYQQAERAFLDGKIDRALVLLDDEKLRLSAVEKGAVENAVQSWLLKAQLFAIQLRFDDAERVYLEAIGAVPESFQTHFAYARFNQKLNRFERARAAFSWCLGWARKNEKDTELAQTLNNLGNLDRDQGRVEEARKAFEAFEEALQINRELAQKKPENYLSGVATTLNNLGVLHNEQNRMEEARKAFEEALKLRSELAQKSPEAYLPDLAQTLNDLGNLDHNQGQMEEGRKEYAEALQIRRELAKNVLVVGNMPKKG